MAYVVHNFKPGAIIYSSEINQMDAQILVNETNINKKINEPTTEGTLGQALVTDGAGGRVWGDVASVDYVGNKVNLTTVDKSTHVAAINEVNAHAGNLNNLTTTAKGSLVEAANEINGNLGDLTTLHTSVKTDAVNAINEAFDDLGDITTLTTTAKSSAVAAINELDSDVGDKSTLTTTAKTNLVAAVNEVNGKIGNLSDLTTDDKTNVVAAINEVDAHADDAVKMIADVFDATKAYKKGDLAIKDNKLYVANADVPVGAWDSSKWAIATTANAYLHAVNPVGNGALSMNRAEGTEVGWGSVTLGNYNKATVGSAIAMGYRTEAIGGTSLTEGSYTKATGQNQHVQGKFNVVNSSFADIVGNGTADTTRSNAYALDWDGTAHYAGDVYVDCADDSTGGTRLTRESVVANEYAEQTYPIGSYVMHDAKLYQVKAAITTAHAWDPTEWNEVKISDKLVAFDFGNIAPAFSAAVAYKAGDIVNHDSAIYVANTDIPAGAWDASKWTKEAVSDALMHQANPTGSGTLSVNRKAGTTAGNFSVAIGKEVTASGAGSFATGLATTATNDGSFAEGSITIAEGNSSHAEGLSTYAAGANSHAEGECTKAMAKDQHVEGRFNTEDTAEKFAHITGNGINDTNRSNAFAVGWNGNAYINGTLYTNCDALSENGKPVATATSVAPEYSETATYVVGAFCTYKGQLYKCTTAIPTGQIFDPTHWLECNLADNLASGAVVETAIGNAYNPTSTYAIGDLVMHDGQLYKANTDITVAEAWTPAHWTATNVLAEGSSSVITDIVTAKKYKIIVANGILGIQEVS